jgi:prepilin-type N-terminal cleavage/methylation domain-containing protein
MLNKDSQQGGEKMKNIRKIAGFTMIELLIVIAVLGILAVAVLSAINPIEQINRGNDTGARGDAEQLIGAVDRFYTQNNFYPWMKNVADTNRASAGLYIDTANMSNATVQNLVNNLNSANNQAGELKSTFFHKLLDPNYNGGASLWIYNQQRSGAGDSTYVCFRPRSSSFLTQAKNRCSSGMPGDVEGTINTSTVCPANTNSSMVCLP